MVAAVVAAAGSGTRFDAVGQSKPKQFRTLCGRPLYSWSLSVLCGHHDIESIVMAVSADLLENVARELESCSFDAGKVSLCAGGATRQESVHLALEFLSGQALTPDYVLVHDAARPFLTANLVSATIECVTASGACTLAVPLVDTIKRVNDGVVCETIDRSSLFLIQTPQAARFNWFLQAHRQAALNGSATTDDAAILELSGHQISIMGGSQYNLKITTPEDFIIGEALAPLLNEQN